MKTKRIVKHLVSYDCTLEICLSDSVNKARESKHAIKRYAPREPDAKDPAGCCVSRGSSIGIYLTPNYCTHECIGHECGHAAGQVLNWAGVDPSWDADEPFCHLAGNIAKLVYGQLKKWKVKIK